jgi:hypothetical protein
MSPADLRAFWRRTTAALQQTPMRAICTDAAAQSGRESVTSLEGFIIVRLLLAPLGLLPHHKPTNPDTRNKRGV